MAKRRPVNINAAAFERAHLERIEKYAAKMDVVYRWAAEEFAKLASTIPNFNPDKLFSFRDYPQTNQRVNDLLKEAYSKMNLIISKGIEAEWMEAALKNDKYVEEVFRSSRLTKKQLEKYNDRNLEALRAFKDRKEAGMSLSNRVWNYTKSFQKEMELGLDIGLGEGSSAAHLSRVLRHNLIEPEKLFRRVRDKRGNLVLSRAAEQYHPGQGVYRSSYKNAMRLTRTETNMAYRASDHARWQQLDFVVGIEIRLSNNPNHCPVCKTLAGKYPKDFKFVGWHPQCRCHAISILKTDEEIDADDTMILNGLEPVEASVNAVRDVPDGFKTWVDQNRDRADRAKSTPYWIRDNFKDGSIDKGLKFSTIPTPAKPKKLVPDGIDKYEKDLGITVDRTIFSLLVRQTPLSHDNPKGAFFHPAGNYINIPIDKRRKDSKWSAEAVVYHEYGHAADWQHGLKELPEVKSLMGKYRKEFAKNKNKLYKSIDAELWDSGIKAFNANEYDVVGKTTAAHDTLMALNKNFGSGHSKAYFSIKGMPEAEFLAHLFENKFLGNDVFKKVMPDLYDDMIKLADEIISKIKK